MIPITPEIEFCRATVRWWERLRLVYNVVLLIPGVLLAWRHVQMGMHPPGPTSLGDTIAICLGFGLVANVCYCLGPYAEIVMVSRGFPETASRTRWLLFGLGLLLSLSFLSVVWITLEVFANPGRPTGP